MVPGLAIGSPPVLLAPGSALLDANWATGVLDVHAIGERAVEADLALALVGQGEVDVGRDGLQIVLALEVGRQRGFVGRLSARDDVCECGHWCALLSVVVMVGR